MSATKERRRFHRFPFDARAILHIGVNSHAACELLDLSINGVLLEVAEPEYIEKAAKGMLGLVIRGEVRGDVVTMNMNVEVVRIDGACLACRIVSVDLASFASLKALVEDNLGDVRMLDRELKQLDYWPGAASAASA